LKFSKGIFGVVQVRSYMELINLQTYGIPKALKAMKVDGLSKSGSFNIVAYNRICFYNHCKYYTKKKKIAVANSSTSKVTHS